MSDDVADNAVITRADIFFAGYEFEWSMSQLLDRLSQLTVDLGFYNSKYQRLSRLLDAFVSEVRDNARTLNQHQLGLNELVSTSAGLARCREEVGELKLTSQPIDVDGFYAAFDHFFRAINHVMIFYRRYYYLLVDRYVMRFVEYLLSNWEYQKQIVADLLEEIPREQVRAKCIGLKITFVVC